MRTTDATIPFRPVAGAIVGERPPQAKFSTSFMRRYSAAPSQPLDRRHHHEHSRTQRSRRRALSPRRLRTAHSGVPTPA